MFIIFLIDRVGSVLEKAAAQSVEAATTALIPGFLGQKEEKEKEEEEQEKFLRAHLSKEVQEILTDLKRQKS